MSPRRMKVLVSAYACEPDRGSEPGVGWNWVQQIARHHDVWVITRQNNRPAIERATRDADAPNPRWIYFDLPRWSRFWKRGRRGIHLYYYLWQIGAYRVARRLQRTQRFDIAHHVTFVNYWLPSLLPLLRVPFVWGPVGGGDSTPGAFYASFGLRGAAYERLRTVARWLGEHDPFVRLSARRARVAVATTPATAARLTRLGAPRVEVQSQVALPAEDLARLADAPQRGAGPFRLVSVGTLLHLKGFHLAIEAFAGFAVTHRTAEYWIIGDGKERGSLERLAARLGIAEQVRFCGEMPRPRVLETLSECDVLVHPGLHESGGWVCVEAMAAGLPVICLDLGGPALQVTSETGVKIRADTPAQVAEDLASAFRSLAEDPELRASVGRNARSRALREFSWERKGSWIDQLYARAASEA